MYLEFNETKTFKMKNKECELCLNVILVNETYQLIIFVPVSLNMT